MSCTESSSSSSSSSARGEIDPLLKDLSERQQSFRRKVVSLASELNQVRERLARETLTRQEAEIRAKNLEEEIGRVQKKLEERNEQLQASTSTAEKYLMELDDLRSQLSATQAIADASAALAQCAQLQCLALLKELDEKNSSFKEHQVRIDMLGDQLDLLHKDLQVREFSQKQLEDEVSRIEHDIMQALAKAGAIKDCELRNLLDAVSLNNFEKISKLLTVKDEEIAKLRDEIRIMSTHWKLKMKDLESHLEKHRRHRPYDPWCKVRNWTIGNKLCHSWGLSYVATSIGQFHADICRFGIAIIFEIIYVVNSFVTGQLYYYEL